MKTEHAVARKHARSDLRLNHKSGTGWPCVLTQEHNIKNQDFNKNVHAFAPLPVRLTAWACSASVLGPGEACCLSGFAGGSIT